MTPTMRLIEDAIFERKPELRDDERLSSAAPLNAVAKLLDEQFPIPDGWLAQRVDATLHLLNRYYPIERAG